MKKIFVIDWILVVVFILSASSGIGLHMAGHDGSHELRHTWTCIHRITSLLFLIAIIFHWTTHRRWYKGIIKNGLGKKSKVTVAISIVFLLLCLTGIGLLGINGVNSPLGLWHYKIGIVMMVTATGHIIKRLPVLRKSVD